MLEARAVVNNATWKEENVLEYCSRERRACEHFRAKSLVYVTAKKLENVKRIRTWPNRKRMFTVIKDDHKESTARKTKESRIHGGNKKKNKSQTEN